MKAIIFFLTLAFFLGLTSFNSEADSPNESIFGDDTSIEQILDSEKLTDLAQNILKQDQN